MNRLDDPPGLMKGRKPSFIGMNGGPETDDQQRLRFQVELEFVQCLANPNYLNFLAQRGYFKDSTFINYLKYLLYWKEPEYAKYLKYPMCLYFLDLLQYEHFRREVVNSQCTKFIDDQQILLWQHYTRRRTRLLQAAAEQTQHVNPQNNEKIIQTNNHSIVQIKVLIYTKFKQKCIPYASVETN
ncbi:mediator complex subunit 31 isoform X2 [Nomia melanderi]|uniref:mediator complex subunit 31 isoform X2 n=1 Tax=Nomia melanderi TaxID=2448451 RepID=UPI0013045358|nr:mediator of RNA polymerase II transcription subunit 31 isoform X2 [Nomia melanderi]XP_031836195.1 mediator of RNA polymerase II transcription subunit 31 isoform X2 [Nomia melanderi]XP_031836196.1 mediator of RNA polymerase II transcription subunit 31 isoform X2 [Nomia melanderi]